MTEPQQSEPEDKYTASQSVGCILIGVAVLIGSPLIIGFLYFFFSMLGAS